MQNRTRQIGGIYGTGFMLLMLACAALLVMKLAPIYMDEAKAAKIVAQVADSSSNANLGIAEIRKVLDKRWNVDSVQNLKVKEVKMRKSGSGKSLAYKYEVRESLVANIDIVLKFEKEFAMRRGG